MIMKKLSFTILLVIIILFAGCSSTDDTPAKSDAQETAGESDESSDEKGNKDIEKQLVMISGELYYNTEKENTMTRKCGAMDGEITSAVYENEIPHKDNQSNFGTGYGYQVGMQEGQIEINIDGKLIVFEHLENETVSGMPD